MTFLFGPKRFTATYPLVTVNVNQPEATMQALANSLGRSEPRTVAACSTVVRDQEPPRAVLHFGGALNFTERQAEALAHELNHLLSALLRVEDRTHTVDGGVLQGEKAMTG